MKKCSSWNEKESSFFFAFLYSLINGSSVELATEKLKKRDIYRESVSLCPRCISRTNCQTPVTLILLKFNGHRKFICRSSKRILITNSLFRFGIASLRQTSELSPVICRSDRSIYCIYG